MTVHILQSEEALAEAQELMTVSSQLLNAQNARPCMGLIQDTLVGGSLMTQKVFLTRGDMMQLMMLVKDAWELPVPAILKPEPLWTGHQAFSLAFPNSLQYGHLPTNANFQSIWDTVVIRDASLLCGTLTKSQLGSTSGGIIQVIAKMFSSAEACEFMEIAQRICNTWLQEQGLSAGVADCLLPAHLQKQIENAVSACQEHLLKIQEKGVKLGIDPEQQEQVADATLGKMLAVAGNILKSGSQHPAPFNGLVSMIEAGSKGSIINRVQITSVVGQQSVDGRRILNENNPVRRTLAWFPPNCTTPASRGFVSHSYLEGLTPPETVFHCMGGFQLSPKKKMQKERSKRGAEREGGWEEEENI